MRTPAWLPVDARVCVRLAVQGIERDKAAVLLERDALQQRLQHAEQEAADLAVERQELAAAMQRAEAAEQAAQEAQRELAAATQRTEAAEQALQQQVVESQRRVDQLQQRLLAAEGEAADLREAAYGKVGGGGGCCHE